MNGMSPVLPETTISFLRGKLRLYDVICKGEARVVRAYRIPKDSGKPGFFIHRVWKNMYED